MCFWNTTCLLIQDPLRDQPKKLLHPVPTTMVYTSPTKSCPDCWVEEVSSQKSRDQQIYRCPPHDHGPYTQTLRKTADPYYVKPKLGHLHIFNDCDTRIAVWMLAKIEASNVTEVIKKTFPEVSHHMLEHQLKEYGLVCQVRRSWPYISPANKENHCLWAMQHAGWMVEDWKHIVGWSLARL